MKIIISFTFLLFASFLSHGQADEKTLPECNCKETFEDMILQVEANYLGLAHMRQSKTDAAYELLKEEFRVLSKDIKAFDCASFLSKFLGSFKDGHLFVFEAPKYTSLELDSIKNKIKSEKLPSIKLKELTEAAISDQDSLDLIGKWTDGKSEFVISKNDGKYNAYILSSSQEGIEPGELKATFRVAQDRINVTYYTYNYTPMFRYGNTYKEGTLLMLSSGLNWGKLESSFDREMQMIDNENIRAPKVISIDKKNTLISIPSFSIDYDILKDVLDENEELIENSVNLIIDIRGNTGGNGIYFGLMKLYATRDKEGGQGEVLASEATLNYFERNAKNSKKIFSPVVERIKSNPGEIVDGPDYPTKKFKAAKNSIQNVAILTDNACASAAESFILHSKQASAKVTTFGSPTYGMIDYTSVNVIALESGKQRIYFGYPTSSLNKDIPAKGYNATGIIPDVPIAKDHPDKIDFIMKYLN